MKPNILLVDDEPAILTIFSDYLSDQGYTVKVSSSLAGARESVALHEFNAVILDLILPDGNGIDLINNLKQTNPDIAIIVVTGAGDIPIAVEAMRRGADNFLTKPVNMAEMDIFLKISLEMQVLKRRDLTSRLLKKKVQLYFGESEKMKEVQELAFSAAKNNLHVLLQGETGTGKSLLANWIHDQSDRSSESFVEVSCSILRGELLASELFGHTKGAFTSAIQDKQGLIDAADGATLFLDEIGDMDLNVQTQFLKVLDEKRYRRLGEVKIRQSDFRMISATNKDLQNESRCGTFRQDLYYRINVFPIYVPPLYERLEDLKGLVQHILVNTGSYHLEVPEKIMDLLRRYPWPGNVRELKNVLERACSLVHGGSLSAEHFRGIETSEGKKTIRKAEQRNLSRLEEEHIRDVLRQAGGDKIKAAHILGISKSALYRKLKKFEEPI